MAEHKRDDPARLGLHQIIEGVAEGIILIDLDGNITWANASALAMHEVKSRAGLGATVKEYRQRFHYRYRSGHKVLKAAYPMVQALDNKTVKETMLFLHLPGEPEPLGIHKIHTLTLLDESDAPQSIAIIHEDVTRRFEADERFERTFAANPAPSMICRMADHRVIKANEGFLQMSGYSHNNLIGRSIKESEIIFDPQLLKLTLGKINDCESIPQTETQLRTADGDLKYVLVAGQPLDVAEETCMLVTFVDLDARRQAEQALKTSEELFSKAFQLAPVPMLVITRAQGSIVYANNAFMSVTRHKESVAGQTLKALKFWAQPTQATAFEAALSRTGRVSGLDALVGTHDGEVLDCVLMAERVRINEAECMLVVVQDITERKRTETELVEAIEAVMQDTSWFSRSVIERLAYIRRPGESRSAETALADLTPREQDVLGAICQGMSDVEIASQLNIARNTVRNHITTLYDKINVNRRSAAVVWARERGFTGAKRRG